MILQVVARLKVEGDEILPARRWHVDITAVGPHYNIAPKGEQLFFTFFDYFFDS
jgi:hypothetical protein